MYIATVFELKNAIQAMPTSNYKQHWYNTGSQP